MSDRVFDPYLLEGEQILWAGRPGQGIVFTARDGFLIPFSLLWGGFALFWESSVVSMNAPFPMKLFGVPFVLLGLYFIIGRFVADAWLRERIVYAITDRRILIARRGPWPSFKAVAFRQLPEVVLTERGDGSGTIRFGASMPPWSRAGLGGYAAWTPALDPVPQFLAIADVRAVYQRLQREIHRPSV